MFPGFPTRLLNYVTNIFKREILKGKEGASKIHISVLVINTYINILQDPARRKYNVFIGASFLADVMKDRDSYWISKQEWEEHGERCLSRISNTLKN